MSIRSKPVLLVIHDDNQLVRQIAKMTSELAEVSSARDTLHAAAFLDSNQPLDAVLVGKAGDGVPAIDILSSVRSKRPQARSIMISDPSDLAGSIEALHSGVVDHIINRPLRERELIAIISLPSPRPIVAAIAVVARPAPVSR
jgi:DNA-binding NtrC family response regulator